MTIYHVECEGGGRYGVCMVEGWPGSVCTAVPSYDDALDLPRKCFIQQALERQEMEGSWFRRIGSCLFVIQTDGLGNLIA